MAGVKSLAGDNSVRDEKISISKRVRYTKMTTVHSLSLYNYHWLTFVFRNGN